MPDYNKNGFYDDVEDLIAHLEDLAERMDETQERLERLLDDRDRTEEPTEYDEDEVWQA